MMDNNSLAILLAMIIAYLIGSLPTGIIATKLFNKPDVRYSGSGHTGGTNTMKIAGPRIGGAVAGVDGLKGLVAYGVAFIITQGWFWALPLAGVMAVIGHCFPIYTKFHGGMGLATAGGLMIIFSPWTIVFAVPTWAVIYVWLYHKQHSPRSVTIALPIAVGLTFGLDNLGIISVRQDVQWFLILVTILIILRHLPEWNRKT